MITTVKRVEYALSDSQYTRRKSTDTLVIHCSDTTATQDIGAAEIRDWHQNERDFIDIGYHLVIRRDGSIEAGRPIWAVGAHATGHNATSIGICLVGGMKWVNKKRVEENNFTDEQWSSLARAGRVLLISFGITKVCGHRDLPGVNKYCPSFDVASWMKANKKLL